MNKIRTIAKTLLEKRNSLNPLIMTGELNRLLGPDGLQEALRRRWVVTDYENGQSHVSNSLSVMEELRHLAEDCGDCQAGYCPACGGHQGWTCAECNTKHKTLESHEACARCGAPGKLNCIECGTNAATYGKEQVAEAQAAVRESGIRAMCMEHATRKYCGLFTTGTARLEETAAPGTGHPGPTMAAPTAPAAPAAPAPQTPTSPSHNKPLEVGNQVRVAEGNETILGTIARIENGKYTLSFGDKKPSNPNKQYAPNELAVVDQNAPANTK